MFFLATKNKTNKSRKTKKEEVPSARLAANRKSISQDSVQAVKV